MNQNKLHLETDPLSQMLRQTPLEMPSGDFTMKIMAKISPELAIEKTPFYKKPFFIAAASILFSGIFLLLYNADFSWTILTSQIAALIENIREIFPSIKLADRKANLSPTLIAPIALVVIIFFVDRIVAAQKRNKEQRSYIF